MLRLINKMEQVMKRIRIEKVTLNIGAGADQAKLEKGMQLLKMITGLTPVKTFTTKRIPEWSIRPGLPIGCKLTLRKAQAMEIVPRLLSAVDNKLKAAQIDRYGNIAFGIREYIDIPNAKYDPAIGIIGLQVCITLERPGYRIKKRRIMSRPLHGSHIISKEEAIEFMKQNFNVAIMEDEY